MKDGNLENLLCAAEATRNLAQLRVAEENPQASSSVIAKTIRVHIDWVTMLGW